MTRVSASQHLPVKSYERFQSTAVTTFTMPVHVLLLLQAHTKLAAHPPPPPPQAVEECVRKRERQLEQLQALWVTDDDVAASQRAMASLSSQDRYVGINGHIRIIIMPCHIGCCVIEGSITGKRCLRFVK